MHRADENHVSCGDIFMPYNATSLLRFGKGLRTRPLRLEYPFLAIDPESHTSPRNLARFPFCRFAGRLDRMAEFVSVRGGGPSRGVNE